MNKRNDESTTELPCFRSKWKSIATPFSDRTHLRSLVNVCWKDHDVSLDSFVRFQINQRIPDADPSSSVTRAATDCALRQCATETQYVTSARFYPLYVSCAMLTSAILWTYWTSMSNFVEETYHWHPRCQMTGALSNMRVWHWIDSPNWFPLCAFLLQCKSVIIKFGVFPRHISSHSFLGGCDNNSVFIWTKICFNCNWCLLHFKNQNTHHNFINKHEILSN